MGNKWQHKNWQTVFLFVNYTRRRGTRKTGETIRDLRSTLIPLIPHLTARTHLNNRINPINNVEKYPHGTLVILRKCQTASQNYAVPPVVENIVECFGVGVLWWWGDCWFTWRLPRLPQLLTSLLMNSCIAAPLWMPTRQPSRRFKAPGSGVVALDWKHHHHSVP